jgi:membrane protein
VASAKSKQTGREGGLDRVLGPVVGLVALLVAMLHSLRDRRAVPSLGPVAVGVVPPARRDDGPEFTGLNGLLARVPGMPFLLRLQRRYGELRGNNLAAAVTFQTFVSLFPLLLVLVAAIGFFAHHSDVDVAGRIVGNLGLTGEGADAVRNAVETAERNRGATAPLGLAALLWSGLGLVNAFQFAFNQVWQVEERGIKDKAVGLLWLAGAVVLFVGASAVTTVVNWLPGFVAPLGIVAGLAVNFALWLWTFRVLPNRDVGWRPLIPGAVLGAVGMEVLKVVGGIYVPRAVANSSALYGSLGVVFAVLAWLLFFGRLLLYSCVLNVLLWERREGTVTTTIEVPAGEDVQSTDGTTRTGRLPQSALRT